MRVVRACICIGIGMSCVRLHAAKQFWLSLPYSKLLHIVVKTLNFSYFLLHIVVLRLIEQISLISLKLNKLSFF